MKNKQFDKKTLGIAFSLVYDKDIDQKNQSILIRKKLNHKSIRFLSELEKETIGFR